MRTFGWTLGLVVVVVVAVGAGRAAEGQLAAQRQKLTSGAYVLELPLGLQADAAYLPESNPLTAAKVELGRLLYFDPRLSKDRTLSCATCHNPYHGFAEPLEASKGVGGQVGKRNSPTVLNRLFSKEQFWDGRAADLEEQAHGPLTNPIEMAMSSHDEVVARLKAIAGYAAPFEKAFGTKEITLPRVAMAIAAYERTVTTGNSAFDRWQAGDKEAMSPAAVRGMELFNGKANCITCHAGFNFSDESYHNLGVGMNAKEPDLGRFVVSKNESERGAFKTPTLRNVVQSAPYMHDGSEPTLRAVIAFYDRGGTRNPWLAKEMRPLGLSAREVDDLLAFLEALTGDVTSAEPPKTLPN